ncbi:MAG TPA: hypothetical protein VM029_13015, partial [Opitutaceae bacterium]|nr:hypothetical protein [Opitutaceae bacterium]
MKRCSLTRAVVLALAFATVASAADFHPTAATVGRHGEELETPVNQRVTPAGKLIELPGVRPNALALSPNRELLVTSGLQPELLVLSPATGAILQHVPFPNDKQSELAPISSSILSASKAAKISFTGLAFSPDGTRIYLADVNGVVRVFGVAADKTVSPLHSIGLPPADAPGRKIEIPAGIAVSADNK